MTAETYNRNNWLHYAGRYSTSAAVRRASRRRRIAWDRVMLVAVAFGCIAAAKTNARIEEQYRNDSQTVYASLAR
jgi:type II secretory pathway component PulL